MEGGADMKISALLVICCALAFSNASLAQEIVTDGDMTPDGDMTIITTDTPVAPAPEAGMFDQLSPGGQKIAESLFVGQSITGDNSAEPMTLDQVAAARQDGQGWGQVFKQMKADGLVEAKNLGQLVSGHNRTSKAFMSGSGGGGARIVLTTARGHKMDFGKSRSNRGRSAHGGRSARSGSSGSSGHVSRGALHSSRGGLTYSGRGSLSLGGRGSSHGSRSGRGHGKSK